MIRFLSTLATWFVTGCLCAVSALDMSCKQWEVIDLPFSATQRGNAPFETLFKATFSGPNGETLEVPGFYDGNTNWKIRFSAASTGTWTYTTYSSEPSLNGHKGRVSVAQSPDSREHGALVTSPKDPRHFYYEDGTPCAVMAFEADWLFALDYMNDKETPKTYELLDALRNNGINQIITTVYSFDVNWDKDPLLEKYPNYDYGGLTQIYPFKGSNVAPNFDELNVEFFQKFDRVVEAMHKRQMNAHLMIYVWNKQVQWPKANSMADNRYFDYIIKRYQAYPNVIWDISKEALNNPRCSEAYAVERIQRIRELDAFERLVTVHDGQFCQRHSDEIDFISWQIWGASIYDHMLGITQQFPHLPILNIEHGGYERSSFEVFSGDYDDPEVCLRRNYMIMFGGAYSTYYWQGAAWNVLIHNPHDHPEMEQPHLAYYKHLEAFFTRYPYHLFEPEPGSNRSAYCLKSDNTYLMYVPKDHCKISAYGNKGIAKEHAKATVWFNTLTGEYRESNPRENHFFTSPWSGEADAILVRTY